MLVVRLDNLGDVLLAGPAVRAVGASGADGHDAVRPERPGGRRAAARRRRRRRVPRARGSTPTGTPSTAPAIDALVDPVAASALRPGRRPDQLPPVAAATALLLRLAGVPTIAAISADFPGTLLDVRHLVARRRARGRAQPVARRDPRPPAAADDDGRLARRLPDARCVAAVRRRPTSSCTPGRPCPARAWAPDANRGRRRRARRRRLARRRHRRAAASARSPPPSPATHGPGVVDLGGRTTSPSWPACSPAPRRSSSATPAPPTSPPPSAPRSCRSTRRPCRSCAGARGGVPHVAARRPGRSRAPAAGPGSCPVAGHPCLAGVAPERRRRRRATRSAARARRAWRGVNIFLWHVHGSWTTAFVQGRTTTSCRSTRTARPGAAAGRGRGTGRRRCVEVTQAEARATPSRRRRAAAAGGARRARPALARRAPAGRDVPAVYLEHNAPQGRIAEMRPSGRRPRRPDDRARHALQRPVLGLRHDARPR